MRLRSSAAAVENAVGVFPSVLRPGYVRHNKVCAGCVCVPDAPSAEQQELFVQKLQQCCMLFDFFDSVTDLKSKEVKRATLNELVEYVSTSRGVLVESAYPDIINMVSTF